MPTDLNLKIVTVSVDKLNPYDNNPRINDHAVPSLAKAIKEYGFLVPVLATKHNGEVIDGHLRLKAAEAAGMTKVPVIYVDHLSETQIKALRISINRSAELAEWDPAKLRKELDVIVEGGGSIDMTGFDQAHFDNLVKGLDLYNHEMDSPVEPKVELPADIDESPEPPATPVSKPGEVYKLGPHRLVCGDCTKEAVIASMMGDVIADICWTDPPWNVAYGTGTGKGGWKKDQKSRQILNDNLGEQFGAFCDSFCTIIKSRVKPGAAIYMAMSAQEWPIIHASLSKAGFHWSSTIIWAKDRLVMSRKDYHTQYEPVWYGWRDDAPRICPLKDRKQTDVWNIPRPSRSDEHPTMKPVELVRRALVNSSPAKAVVFEPFGGSGTTLIASAVSGRVCYCSELDPRFVDVIRKRWTKWAVENKVPVGSGGLE
jgi:DNA modification methylase